MAPTGPWNTSGGKKCIRTQLGRHGNDGPFGTIKAISRLRTVAMKRPGSRTGREPLIVGIDRVVRHPDVEDHPGLKVQRVQRERREPQVLVRVRDGLPERVRGGAEGPAARPHAAPQLLTRNRVKAGHRVGRKVLRIRHPLDVILGAPGQGLENAGSPVSGFVPAAFTCRPWSDADTTPSSATKDGGRLSSAQVPVRSRPSRKSSLSRTFGGVISANRSASVACTGRYGGRAIYRIRQ
jgi:hypothetical protein